MSSVFPGAGETLPEGVCLRAGHCDQRFTCLPAWTDDAQERGQNLTPCVARLHGRVALGLAPCGSLCVPVSTHMCARTLAWVCMREVRQQPCLSVCVASYSKGREGPAVPSVPFICRHWLVSPLQSGRTESINLLDSASLQGALVQRAVRGILASEPRNAAVFPRQSQGFV